MALVVFHPFTVPYLSFLRELETPAGPSVGDGISYFPLGERKYVDCQLSVQRRMSDRQSSFRSRFLIIARQNAVISVSVIGFVRCCFRSFSSTVPFASSLLMIIARDGGLIVDSDLLRRCLTMTANGSFRFAFDEVRVSLFFGRVLGDYPALRRSNVSGSDHTLAGRELNQANFCSGMPTPTGLHHPCYFSPCSSSASILRRDCNCRPQPYLNLVPEDPLPNVL